MPETADPIRTRAIARRRLKAAYVVERAATLGYLLVVAVWTTRLWTGPATIVATAVIAALVIGRLLSPLWLRLLAPPAEAVRAGRRWRTDAAESAVLLAMGMAFGYDWVLGVITAGAAGGLGCTAWIVRNRGRTVPPPRSTSPVPPAARAAAEELGFPAARLAVDHSAEVAARTIRHHGRALILLAPWLVREFTPREIAVVLAHELAHLDRRDLLRADLHRFGLGAAAVVVVAAMVRLAFAAGDGAGFGPALAAGGIAMACTEILALPAAAWLSWRLERRANRWALEHTGDREAFTSAMTKLHNRLGAPAEPSWSSRLLGQEHPSLADALADATPTAPHQPDRPTK